MYNEFYKKIANAMDTAEKNKYNNIYLISPAIEKNAKKLYSHFNAEYKNAKISYNPAYLQIVVMADTYVFDICTKENKQDFFNADVICIDTALNGMLHIECVFNNAFRIVGDIE